VFLFILILFNAFFAASEIAVLSLNNNKISKDDIVNAFVRESTLAVQDGASSIIMGCMSMAFHLLDEEANKAVDVPIINPAKVSINAAESLILMKLAHSRQTYPKSDLMKLKNSVLPNLL
jgi:Asp/Glu/hydantoin racemase